MEITDITNTFITGDITVPMIVEAIGSLIAIVILFAIIYRAYNIFFQTPMVERLKTRTELLCGCEKNELYLDNLYTAYKAGIVMKTAEEENVTLTPRPIEPVKNIADTLKEQVKTEISN